MCSTSGKGTVQVSRELGKSKAYVSATINRGNVPRVDTLAEIAKACGYKVVLEGHGERIELDAGWALDPIVEVEYEGR
jgi:hypothetical protein